MDADKTHTLKESTSPYVNKELLKAAEEAKKVLKTIQERRERREEYELQTAFRKASIA